MGGRERTGACALAGRGVQRLRLLVATIVGNARNPAAPTSRGRAMRFAFLAAVLIFAVTPEAHAYRTAADLPEFEAERVAWSSSRISIGFADTAFNDEAFAAVIDEPTAERALAASVATWNEVPCSTFEFVDSPTPDVVIRVEPNWEARGFEADAAATTDVSYRVSGNDAFIGAAQLIFNAAAFSEASSLSFQAVLTHEMGHVLGLLHPCEDDCTAADEGSALHPIYHPSQVMLGSDDVEGLCFLYPAECEGPACDTTCRQVDSAEASDECPWLGDPCLGETGSLCAYGRCASDGYCSLSCETARDCSGRQSCSEGLCLPDRAHRYGASCDRGNDCLSLLCVSVGEDSMCTRGCDGIACPGDDLCALVDDQAVCTPPVPASGCSLAQTKTSAPAFGLTCLFLLLSLRRRRTSSAFRTNSREP